jgi:hypothetical protein
MRREGLHDEYDVHIPMIPNIPVDTEGTRRGILSNRGPLIRFTRIKYRASRLAAAIRSPSNDGNITQRSGTGTWTSSRAR